MTFRVDQKCSGRASESKRSHASRRTFFVLFFIVQIAVVSAGLDVCLVHRTNAIAAHIYSLCVCCSQPFVCLQMHKLLGLARLIGMLRAIINLMRCNWL